MKKVSDLIPFRFAWRGAIGGLLAPLAFVLFGVLRNPNPMAIIYLLPFSGIAVVVGGGIGTVSGFIIGLFYKDGMKVGLRVRSLVAFGVPAFVGLPFMIAFQTGALPIVVFILLTGLLPAIVTTPKLLWKTSGER